MFRRCLTLVLFLSILGFAAHGQTRTEIPLPDLPGHVTLRCDLHLHTVYSDGSVLPPVRVDEAWRDGLDVIAITDHVEHKDGAGDVNKADMNRAYEVAKPAAEALGILLLPGGEITRAEPHGHLNAIGISDANPLSVNDDYEAVKRAVEQGAFVFWNHPEWKVKDGTAWSPIQEDYAAKNWMQGLEVYNGMWYQPRAHQWALDHNLTFLGNSDAHAPVPLFNPEYHESRRPMTIVFAKAYTAEGVYEALRARRTVAFGNNNVAGNRAWLEPFFLAMVETRPAAITAAPGDRVRVGIRNTSGIDLLLSGNGVAEGLQLPNELKVPAGKVVLVSLRYTGSALTGPKTVSVPVRVENFLAGTHKPLETSMAFSLKPAAVEAPVPAPAAQTAAAG